MNKPASRWSEAPELDAVAFAFLLGLAIGIVTGAIAFLFGAF